MALVLHTHGRQMLDAIDGQVVEEAIQQVLSVVLGGVQCQPLRQRLASSRLRLAEHAVHPGRKADKLPHVKELDALRARRLIKQPTAMVKLQVLPACALSLGAEVAEVGCSSLLQRHLLGHARSLCHESLNRSTLSNKLQTRPSSQIGEDCVVHNPAGCWYVVSVRRLTTGRERDWGLRVSR